MDTPKITNQGVAVFAMLCAVFMTFGAFFLSRSDHDLKLMSLQAVLTLAGSLIGIAGTLLVGVQAYKSLTTNDLPPGSVLNTNQQTEIKTPPIDLTSPNPKS